MAGEVSSNARGLPADVPCFMSSVVDCLSERLDNRLEHVMECSLCVCSSRLRRQKSQEPSGLNMYTEESCPAAPIARTHRGRSIHLPDS